MKPKTKRTSNAKNVLRTTTVVFDSFKNDY